MLIASTLSIYSGHFFFQFEENILELIYTLFLFCFFFFQAEDGIRDLTVTGVQTCALPISRLHGGGDEARTTHREAAGLPGRQDRTAPGSGGIARVHQPARREGEEAQIGRASCRERV